MWISPPCSPLSIICMELCMAEKSRWHQRLSALACLSSAQSENQQTKARQFRARSKSSCQFCHLPTTNCSQFSICCVSLLLSQSTGLTFAEYLWARYSLPSCNLRFDGYYGDIPVITGDTMIWIHCFLRALHEGAPCDGELLLFDRQIRWWLQLHQPREVPVKAVSHSRVNQLV